MKKLVVYLVLFLTVLGLGYFLGTKKSNAVNKEVGVTQTLKNESQLNDVISKEGLEERVVKNEDVSNSNIPDKVLNVLKYVSENHAAIDGYVGGRKFKNLEGNLPKQDQEGKRISYKEWDVNPHIDGKNRGAERLVTGSDGSAYYTDNHYETFKKIQ